MIKKVVMTMELPITHLSPLLIIIRDGDYYPYDILKMTRYPSIHHTKKLNYPVNTDHALGKYGIILSHDHKRAKRESSRSTFNKLNLKTQLILTIY